MNGYLCIEIKIASYITSEVLCRHNSEKSEDSVFQKTGSVTQKVPEVEEEGEKFEKKNGFTKCESGKIFFHLCLFQVICHFEYYM